MTQIWETHEHTLAYPIKVLDAEGKEVERKIATIRMPDGMALVKIEKLVKENGLANADKEAAEEQLAEVGIELSLKMLAIISDLGDDAFKLHIKDITDLGEVMAPFLEGALQQLAAARS